MTHTRPSCRRNGGSCPLFSCRMRSYTQMRTSPPRVAGRFSSSYPVRGERQPCFGRRVVRAQVNVLEWLQQCHQAGQVHLAAGAELQPLQAQAHVPVRRLHGPNAASRRQSRSRRVVVRHGDGNELLLLVAQQLVVAANALLSLLCGGLRHGGLRDVVLGSTQSRAATRREAVGTLCSSSASRTPASVSNARIAAPSVSARWLASSAACRCCSPRLSSWPISSPMRLARLSSSCPCYGLILHCSRYTHPLRPLSLPLHPLALSRLVGLLLLLPSSRHHAQLLLEAAHRCASHSPLHATRLVLVELAGVQQLLLVSQPLPHLLQLLHHLLLLGLRRFGGRHSVRGALLFFAAMDSGAAFLQLLLDAEPGLLALLPVLGVVSEEGEELVGSVRLRVSASASAHLLYVVDEKGAAVQAEVLDAVLLD